MVRGVLVRNRANAIIMAAELNDAETTDQMINNALIKDKLNDMELLYLADLLESKRYAHLSRRVVDLIGADQN